MIYDLVQRTEQEKAVNAEFHYQLVLNPRRSAQVGRAVYDDVLYVRLQVRGQTMSIIDRAVRPSDKHEYPTAWAKWQAQNEVPAHGTPLAHLPGITPSIDDFFRSAGVRTLEGVVEMDEKDLLGAPNGLAIQARARAYLAALVAAPIAADVPVGEEPDIERDVTIKRKPAGRPAGNLN